MKRILALLLLAAMLLAGCGTDKKPYTPTGDALEYGDDYTGPQYTKEPEQSDQSLTLTYYPDRSMNPFSCTDFTNRALFSLLYQGLFSVDRGYNVEPVLCSRYSMSKDMKTYVFYLENATFGDGSVLTAADVSASLLAAKDSAYYKGRFLHITQIQQTSDGGVELILDTPMENLPILLDIPIVKAAQTLLDQPSGTGPYVMDTTTAPGVLRRNTNWWCKAEMAVTAPAIQLMIAQSNTGIRDDFEFNDLGLVCADPGSDNYADYRCDYELWDCENNIFLYVGCNMESAVFSNAAIRSALVRAVDRDTLTENYYRGFARSASLPASPLFPHYSNALAQKYTYDQGESLKNAVTGARLETTAVVFLVNSDDSMRVRIARDIAKMLTACGLTVQMSELPTTQFNKALQKRTYDLYLGQTKLSPNMDLSGFFATKGAMQYGQIGDVGLYTLCTEALANYGNYYTLHQKVMDDGRICPILFRSYAIYATRGLLTGLTPARDNVFYYSLGKSMEDVLIAE